jgi:hypothetical protein
MKTIKFYMIGLASILMITMSGCEKVFSTMTITNNSPYTYAVYLDDTSKGAMNPKDVMAFTIDPGIYQLKAIQMSDIQGEPDTKGGTLQVLEGEEMTWTFY